MNNDVETMRSLGEQLQTTSQALLTQSAERECQQLKLEQFHTYFNWRLLFSPYWNQPLMEGTPKTDQGHKIIEIGSKGGCAVVRALQKLIGDASIEFNKEVVEIQLPVQSALELAKKLDGNLVVEVVPGQKVIDWLNATIRHEEERTQALRDFRSLLLSDATATGNPELNNIVAALAKLSETGGSEPPSSLEIPSLLGEGTNSKELIPSLLEVDWFRVRRRETQAPKYLDLGSGCSDHWVWVDEGGTMECPLNKRSTKDALKTMLKDELGDNYSALYRMGDKGIAKLIKVNPLTCSWKDGKKIKEDQLRQLVEAMCAELLDDNLDTIGKVESDKVSRFCQQKVKGSKNVAF